MVGETGRGDQAVELVAEYKPDLAILDVKMPGMDGIAAARQIVSQYKVAVLILTAFSQRDLIEEARDAGALAYLIKPFQRAELIPAIEVAMARFAEIRALEEENEGLEEKSRSLEEQLETRRLVDRAKGLLMDSYGLKEHEAFSFIQHTAMDKRTRMRDIAQQILEGVVSPD